MNTSAGPVVALRTIVLTRAEVVRWLAIAVAGVTLSVAVGSALAQAEWWKAAGGLGIVLLGAIHVGGVLPQWLRFHAGVALTEAGISVEGAMRPWPLVTFVPSDVETGDPARDAEIMRVIRYYIEHPEQRRRLVDPERAIPGETG